MTSANSVIFRLLLGGVVLFPVALGGYRPWAWSLFGTLLGLLLLAWAITAILGTAQAPISLRRLWPAAACFAAALLWAGFQTIGVADGEGWTHPLWEEAAATLAVPLSRYVSVDPEATRTAILRQLGYAGVFLLAVQLGRDRGRAREALAAVAIAGIVYGIYGLIVYFSGWERILWLEKWSYFNDLTSTFVNRNAYGAYAGLGILCCLAMFFRAIRTRSSKSGTGAYDLTESFLLHGLPYLIGTIVVGTALLLSHSRGAFLSTGLGIILLLTMVAAAGMIRMRAAVLSGLVLVVIGFGLVGLSGDTTLQRLADTPVAMTQDSRSDLFRLTWAATLDAPWTGHGLGAYLPAFRIYRDTTLASPVIWDLAHQVHLETMMDLGIPAAAALYLSVALVLKSCFGGIFRRRRDHVYAATAIAAAALLAAHGFVDFSLQMPAITATFALLLGIGFAQSWRSQDLGSDTA